MFLDPIVADNQMPQGIADGDARINARGRIVFLPGSPDRARVHTIFVTR
jgi:hypothetical protein